jgi:hypothetical protein
MMTKGDNDEGASRVDAMPIKLRSLAARVKKRRKNGSPRLGDRFEHSTILRPSPDGLTRVITRSSWDRRESVLVEAYEAELLALRRWGEFHREAKDSLRAGEWRRSDDEGEAECGGGQSLRRDPDGPPRGEVNSPAS